MQLTPHEWDTWAKDPCTKEFIIHLEETINDAQFDWSHQRFIDLDSIERSDRLNLYALAGIETIRNIIAKIDDKVLNKTGESE